MTLTRMIFAIQMTDDNPTRLRVSGDIGTPAPLMTCLRRGGGGPSPVGCVDGSWTTDLAKGDYIVEIQVDDDDWLAGRLDIVAELTPGQSPPVFVYDGPRSSQPTWTATALYVDPPESSAAGDPKDPWPPPPPPPWITLEEASVAWFSAELATARARIAGQLAAAGGKCIPASVLDAFVTEP